MTRGQPKLRTDRGGTLNKQRQIQLPPAEQAVFLQEGHKAALATLDKDGFPHVVAMGFLAKDDAIYVQEGSATFVTGGTVVDPRPIAPEEIRGKEITGGETQTIAKGDVIIVPAGTPHWFKEVPAPMTYYVVKAR